MENKIKETLLTISLGFMIIFAIVTRLWNLTDRAWILYIAIGVALVGITWPWLSLWIHRGWFFLADNIGFVVSRVILSVAFVVLVIPFGLLSRLFRKDLMCMKGKGESYYIDRKHAFSAEDFENPW